MTLSHKFLKGGEGISHTRSEKQVYIKPREQSGSPHHLALLADIISPDNTLTKRVKNKTTNRSWNKLPTPVFSLFHVCLSLQSEVRPSKIDLCIIRNVC
jgi:hypothetical protein